MLLEKLEILTSLPSVSGDEGNCANWLKDELTSIADSVVIDQVGNFIAVKGKPQTYVFAHMDKIGYMVSQKIDNDIIVVPIKKKKSVEEASWPVIIHGTKKLDGILKLKDELLQIELNEEQINSVSIGDFVSLVPNFLVDKNILTSQGLDNKLGVLAGLEVFKQSRNIGFVATVQEENTKLGAYFATTTLKPKSVIVLDVTYDENKHIKTGNGPTICLKDDLLADKPLINKLISTATNNDIPYQLEVLESGSSDANSVYNTNGFTPHVFVGIPIKNMHSPHEIADINDLSNTIKLLTNFYS